MAIGSGYFILKKEGKNDTSTLSKRWQNFFSGEHCFLDIFWKDKWEQFSTLFPCVITESFERVLRLQKYNNATITFFWMFKKRGVWYECPSGMICNERTSVIETSLSLSFLIEFVSKINSGGISWCFFNVVKNHVYSSVFRICTTT